MKLAQYVFGSILFFSSVFNSMNIYSQDISPILVGNNVWYIDPSKQVWDLTEQSGVTSIRIGGHAYDKNVPSKKQLLDWVSHIQDMNAVPILQVSQYGSPEEAAELVKYFNIDRASGLPIKYWNIGNEPWLQANKPERSEVGELVESYFKPIAKAMKEVDSTIKIYGPDFCEYIDIAVNDLFGGKNDISGKIPGKEYYYCDGISWHRYPQDDNINLAYEGIEDFKNAIIKCKAKVDSVNIQHNRKGNEALGWAIGEYNAKGGREVHTWENGQMFGGILGLCMKYGATYATTWSMFEHDGRREGTDFSSIDGENMTPRPSYRHMEMIAKNFKGQYIDGISNNEDFIVFGSKYSDTISVMIMNRSKKSASYSLNLNDSDKSNNQIQLNINANSKLVHNDIIPGLATHTLVFINNKIYKTEYANLHFENELSPPQSIIINPSTLPNYSEKSSNSESTLITEKAFNKPQP